jgi:hypothetical protein
LKEAHDFCPDFKSVLGPAGTVAVRIGTVDVLVLTGLEDVVDGVFAIGVEAGEDVV